jgi:hypothetical protein
MSCLAAAAVAAITSAACPAGSYWQILTITKIAETYCPAEIARPMGGPLGSRYDATIAWARQRAVDFTANHRPELTPGQVEAEFRAYETRLVAQTAENHAKLGCQKLAHQLGLSSPDLAVTPERAMHVAKTEVLTSTRRGDDIPARDQNGTMMAHSLQRAVMQALHTQGGCEAGSFKAEVVSRNELPAIDPPPFVKPNLAITEKWTGLCNGKPKEALITYRQDQRKWYTYNITYSVEAPTTAAPAQSVAPVPMSAASSGLPTVSPQRLPATTQNAPTIQKPAKSGAGSGFVVIN